MQLFTHMLQMQLWMWSLTLYFRFDTSRHTAHRHPMDYGYTITVCDSMHAMLDCSRRGWCFRH